MTKLTYLCGGIAGLTDAQCNDWRSYAKEHLKTFTLDPMRRDYRGRISYPDVAAKIVTDDIADIRASDFILVNATKPSWGSAQEIIYAFNKGVHTPIVAFIGEDAPSPWLVFHCDNIVRTLEEAVELINDQVN